MTGTAAGGLGVFSSDISVSCLVHGPPKEAGEGEPGSEDKTRNAEFITDLSIQILVQAVRQLFGPVQLPLVSHRSLLMRRQLNIKYSIYAQQKK